MYTDPLERNAFLAGTFPKWLRQGWICLVPFGFPFACRIAWEKTFLTWLRGPQMIGFSLMHVHPMFFLGGLLCSYGFILWLITATIYLIKGGMKATKLDAAMYLLGLFIVLALVVPDFAFASR